VVDVPSNIQSRWIARIFQGEHDQTGHLTTVLDADEAGHPDPDDPKLVATEFVKNGRHIAAALYPRRNQMWLFVVAHDVTQDIYSGRWIPFDPPQAPPLVHPFNEARPPRRA